MWNGGICYEHCSTFGACYYSVRNKKFSYLNGMQRDILQKLTMKYRPAGIRNKRRSLATEGCTYGSRS